jgi:hypothetical protein
MDSLNGDDVVRGIFSGHDIDEIEAALLAGFVFEDPQFIFQCTTSLHGPLCDD